MRNAILCFTVLQSIYLIGCNTQKQSVFSTSSNGLHAKPSYVVSDKLLVLLIMFLTTSTNVTRVKASGEENIKSRNMLATRNGIYSVIKLNLNNFGLPHRVRIHRCLCTTVNNTIAAKEASIKYSDRARVHGMYGACSNEASGNGGPDGTFSWMTDKTRTLQIAASINMQTESCK